MIAERILWWLVLLWAAHRAWLANARASGVSVARHAANQAGSEMLAECVARIQRSERWVQKGFGEVSATRGFRVGEDRFVLTVRRREPSDG